MSSSHRIERDRGIKEARQQMTLLREKWPFAFPEKRQEVRLLVLGAAREIAAAMGWSLPYTLRTLITFSIRDRSRLRSDLTPRDLSQAFCGTTLHLGRK
jgi:hypothetical protein